VTIGAYSVIHDHVVLGEGSVVQEFCVLGDQRNENCRELFIGPRSIIRSHTVIYPGSRFEEQLETGHHVVIRENTLAGANLRVGNYGDIEGNCTIGDYCRFHGYVHVGKGARIGHFVWLFSLTTATNDPLPPSELNDPVTIEDGAVVCVEVTMMPGTVIGKGAFVCSGATASGTIPPGAVITGHDCKVVNHVSRLMHLPSGLRHPWMRHYRKGYPAGVQPRLDILLKEINATRHDLVVQTD
jgi:UDP-3-O-[3-hydroxymyristoyl] glucosamine N-acyltransferase